MHAMTRGELAEFRRLKVISRTGTVQEIKEACSLWVRSAPSLAARMRRRNLVRAVRGSHSEV